MVMFLAALGLCAFLPALTTIPPIDRDEPRYAQAAKQMMESRDYVDIRFQDQPRYVQPAGIYWLHVAAVRLTGRGVEAPIWVHRLPSVAGAILAIILTWWVGLTLGGEVSGIVAALFMAASVLLGFEARNGTIDAVLLATILSAMGFLGRAYLRLPLSRGQAAQFWVTLAVGLMLKGPIILLVVGLTAATLSVLDRSARWLRALRPWPGIALLLLLALPWYVAICLRSGGEFFRIAFGLNLLGKVVVGRESHGLLPGTYLLYYWFTFWPAAALVIPAAPWVWKHRQDRAIRFCLAWLAPTWVVFELIATKLPHYVLPVYPAIAILLGLALADGQRPGPALKWLMTAGAMIYGLLGAGLLFALERRVSAPAVLLALAGATIFAWALHTPRLTPRSFAAVLAVGALLLHTATFGFVLPALQTVWVTPRLVAAIQRHAGSPHPQVAAVGFHEPSLVFLTGTDTKLVFAREAAEFLLGAEGRVAIVEKRDEPEFLAQFAALERSPVLRERVTGISIGRFGRVDIGVYTFAR